MAGEFEKLAYEAALRGLDKQEGMLEELRTRTGVFWDSNDTKIKWLTRAYTVAATALVVEILSAEAPKPKTGSGGTPPPPPPPTPGLGRPETRGG